MERRTQELMESQGERLDDYALVKERVQQHLEETRHRDQPTPNGAGNVSSLCVALELQHKSSPGEYFSLHRFFSASVINGASALHDPCSPRTRVTLYGPRNDRFVD